MSPLLCNWCDRPASGHGIRYAAMVGDHEWTPGEPPSEPREAIPHPLGGITYPVDPGRTPGGGAQLPPMRQWIEDTDPSPVAEPPLPPVSEDCYPPGAVDLPVEYAGPAPIRRILNATRRNT